MRRRRGSPPRPGAGLPVWIVPVRTAGEGVEDGFFAPWIQLEHHSAPGDGVAGAVSAEAAADGGAVKVARFVSNQARGRT